MNILVSGATGFVGRNLTNVLVESNTVYALVRESTNTSILDNRIKLIEIEDDINVLIKQVNEKEIEGIIHLASLFLTDHKPSQIKSLIQSNVLLGTELLETAAKTDVKWFINTGTFWQHFNNDLFNPVNLYASTKQAFEDISKFYIETTDLRIVTLKINDTFGPNDIRSKIFNLWEKISETGESLDMSPGDQLMDICYIDDVVAAYLCLVELVTSNEKFINGEVYSLKAKKRVTLKRLAEIFQEISGKHLNISWGGRTYKKREVMNPWDGGKEIPGFEQKVSLEEGISRYLNRDFKE